MNEIVKYNNHMNLLNFDSFTATDFNVFFALCSIFKEKGDTCITLSFSEIKRLIDYKSTSQERFIEDLNTMNTKLQQVNSKTKVNNITLSLILFPTYIIDENKKTLSIRINPDFAFLLNDLTSHFTLFELKEFVGLKSKYSKTLYRMLKQWRSVGQYEINDLDKFKEMMDIPASYSNSRITARCITPAITELTETKSFEDLAVRPIRKGIGGTICGYISHLPRKKRVAPQHTLVLLKKLLNHPKARMGKINLTILRNVPMTLQNWKNYYYLLILKTEILKRETDKHYRKTVSLFFFSCSTTNALANYSSSVIVIVQLWHSQCAPASLLPLTPACTLT